MPVAKLSSKRHVARAKSTSTCSSGVSQQNGLPASGAAEGLYEKNVACDFVLGDFEWLGHTRITLRSENGPVIWALVDCALGLAEIGCNDLAHMTMEQSAAYDSQSNGGTGVGVLLFRGPLGTAELCL